jgi:hypothetical protein
MQPAGEVYVTVAVPPATPETIPEELPMEAIIEDIDHIPPDGEPLMVVVLPSHTVVVPDMVGIGSTVTL